MLANIVTVASRRWCQMIGKVVENGTPVGGAEEWRKVRNRAGANDGKQRNGRPEKRERREKHTQEVGAFAGRGKPSAVNSRGQLERRREQ